jgi:hypothetical protein
MFGKPYSEYLRFQKSWLIVIAAVGLARLVLSLAGVPVSIVQLVSMNVVALPGVLYYGVRVGRSGFGSYRHLLPLVFDQAFLINGIAILGIGLSVMGLPNIYDVPETRPPFAQEASPAGHALAHLVIGNIAATLTSWALASLTMWIAGRFRK